jgi:hypothetical protein
MRIDNRKVYKSTDMISNPHKVARGSTMQKRKRWTKYTTFMCSPEQRAYLENLCNKKNVGMGELMREFINGMMKKEGTI